ncbi:hypothetical protein [Desulfobacter sp.]|uniref:hypothetical protein n=1 Tax=Desulfobacter sp. TaxID=2294 RepID=UPI003D110BB9
MVFTTPYILINLDGKTKFFATQEDWETFFDRNLKASSGKDRIEEYKTFMKFGKNKHYWNEYIMDGYVNYQSDMILLTGFLDIPLSMPPFKRKSERAGRVVNISLSI